MELLCMRCDCRTHKIFILPVINLYSPWGEHEIDYVLFFTIKSRESITLNPHPDEVDDVKWVTKDELVAMMERKDLLFSPWFRIIVKKWIIGSGWWNDLTVTMSTNKYCDFTKIHQFDPPTEHLGGNGNAQLMFTANVTKAEAKIIGDAS